MPPRTPLTITERGRHHVLGYAHDRWDVWRVGRLRNHLVASYPQSAEGHQAGQRQLRTLEPTVDGVPSPGQLFTPTAFSRVGTAIVAGMVTAVVATGVLVGYAVSTANNRGTDTAVATLNQTKRRPPTTVLLSSGSISATDSPTFAVANGQSGWVYSDHTSAIFVQWTRTKNTVAGSLTAAFLDQSGQKITSENEAFTGVVAGRSVSLALHQGFGTVTTLAVQISGSSLVVSWPQPDGTLVPLTFTAGKATAYNADVAALRERVSKASSASVSASASASAQASADTAVDSAIKTLSSDVADLVSDASTLRSDIADEAADVQSARDDAATVMSDGKTIAKEAASAPAGDYDVCADVDSMQGDVDVLTGDQDTVQGDKDNNAIDIAAAITDESKVSQDKKDLAAAQSDDPGYQSSETAPSTGAIAKAVKAGHGALSAISKAESANTKTVKALVTEAKAAHKKASTVAGC